MSGRSDPTGDIQSGPAHPYDDRVGKHATDEIMSNDKATSWMNRDASPVPKAEDRKAADEKRPEKVAALAIDENDTGSDPYNHTGSHAIPDFAVED